MKMNNSLIEKIFTGILIVALIVFYFRLRHEKHTLIKAELRIYSLENDINNIQNSLTKATLKIDSLSHYLDSVQTRLEYKSIEREIAALKFSEKNNFSKDKLYQYKYKLDSLKKRRIEMLEMLNKE